MRTLVTGGAGFIGSTLVDRLLADGHEVVVVDDFSSGSEANLAAARASAGDRLVVHVKDIRDDGDDGARGRRRAPRSCSTSRRRPTSGCRWPGPRYDASINVIGLLNVLEGAREGGARKVVFASSGGTIYGEPDPAVLPVDESQPELPDRPLRRGQEGRHRLPAGLPGRARPRLDLAGPGQRLRPPPGPPRRGRRRRHLRRAPAGGRAVHDLRHGRADPGLRLRRRRRRRLRPGRRPRAARTSSTSAPAEETSVERRSTPPWPTPPASPTRRPTPPPAPASWTARALDAGKAQRELGWSPQVTLEDGVKAVLDWSRSR